MPWLPAALLLAAGGLGLALLVQGLWARLRRTRDAAGSLRTEIVGGLRRLRDGWTGVTDWRTRRRVGGAGHGG